MHKTIMLALAAGSLLAGGAAMTKAEAQGAPPPPPMDRPGPGMDGHGPGMDGHGPGMRPPMMDGAMHHGGGMMHRMRAFALIYPAPDRALSGPDVQKIAEAFLLFNGNHTWKVTEVTEEPNRVTFAYATPDGTAIAHFAMDRHTARPERIN